MEANRPRPVATEPDLTDTQPGPALTALLGTLQGPWARSGSPPPPHTGCTSFTQLSRALIEASAHYAHASPPLALAAARAAVASARAVDSSTAARAERADARAEAWACLANALRINEDHQGAEAAWRRVGAFVRQGTGKVTLLAQVAQLKASLRRDQRRFAEAVQELRLAIELATRGKDRHREGAYRLNLSAVLWRLVRPQAALREVLRAQRLLDRNREPQHLFGALHQEVLILADLGKSAHALLLSKQIEPLYLKFTGPVFHLRGLWVKGQLHARVGEHASAAAHFEHIRSAFLERGLLYDAALVSLDLALAYAELGERQRVWTLAHQMYEVFRAKQIPQETSAVLILFARTALDEGADVAFILDLLRRLGGERRDQGAL